MNIQISWFLWYFHSKKVDFITIYCHFFYLVWSFSDAECDFVFTRLFTILYVEVDHVRFILSTFSRWWRRLVNLICSLNDFTRSILALPLTIWIFLMIYGIKKIDFLIIRDILIEFSVLINLSLLNEFINWNNILFLRLLFLVR